MSNIQLSNISEETEQNLNNTISYLDSISIMVEQYADNIVNANCSELDGYVDYVKSVIADNDNEIPTKILEDITISLPVLLYQLADVCEKIGIKEDMSKSLKAEVYNKLMITLSGKATENKCRAELETQSENLALIIYQRAYKLIKTKMDFGIELLQSVKKILSKRITEIELNRSTN